MRLADGDCLDTPAQVPYPRGVPVAITLQLTPGRALRAARIMAAVVGVLALALGSIGVHYHVAAEAHAICEHGAEVHVTQVGDARPPPPPDGAPTLAAPTWWQEHGDHHCAAAAQIVVAEPQLLTAVVAMDLTRDDRVPPIAQVASPSRLYRLAPKTSPPV